MNPFPGLRPFHEDEEKWFFGRESQVDTMIDKLAQTHFLAVVGTSGSGKSSLVNCGLRPNLHRGRMAGAGTSWRIAQFRPGNNPIHAMAAALAENGVLYDTLSPGPFTPAEIVESTLRTSKLGLIDVFEQALLGTGVNLLIIADQFEELFRYQELRSVGGVVPAQPAEQATSFLNLLLEITKHKPPIYVVLTMRSDFLGECSQFYGLPEAINGGQYLVPRMSRQERRRAIAQPVGVECAEIDPVLLTRLVNDVGSSPDQLSILQHALNRTWEQWEIEGSKGKLTLAHYETIGTMADALDQHAEEAYTDLTTPAEQKICETLFKALTDKASDPRGVRRPTSVEMLCRLTGASEDDLKKVIDVFRQPSRSFLMPPYPEQLFAETVIDISHESLMRVSKRLRIWSDEEARSAATYRRLSETAILQAAGTASLWRGRDLASALAWKDEVKPDVWWAERYAPGFRAAMDFLQKSAESEAMVRREEIDQALRNAQTEARHARATAWLFFALIVAILAGGILYRQNVMNRHKFEEISRLAEKNKLELSKRLSEAQVLTSQLVALQSFAAGEQKPVDDQKIHQSFAALEQIAKTNASEPSDYRAQITIRYYRKPTDSQKLAGAFKELGFVVTEEPALNPRETNCIWYGSEIRETDVKLVALAVIRAGLDLKGIQPLTKLNHETHSIQVGHNPTLEEEPSFTADVVSNTGIYDLRRREATEKSNVTGTITEVDSNRREGLIKGPEGPVYFRFAPEPQVFNVGDSVTFTLYYGRRMYAEGVKRLPTRQPAAPAVSVTRSTRSRSS
jgi:energy-coupling factor transporter ATP-binding protein EcfA2